MPVKLSGELVEDARSSAKLFHRSLTGQIEHWASIGRTIESQLSGDALAELLEHKGGLKISQVADRNQRRQLMIVLKDFLSQPADDGAWLREISAGGVPLYGTESDNPEVIVQLNPDGSQKVVNTGATPS